MKKDQLSLTEKRILLNLFAVWELEHVDQELLRNNTQKAAVTRRLLVLETNKRFQKLINTSR